MYLLQPTDSYLLLFLNYGLLSTIQIQIGHHTFSPSVTRANLRGDFQKLPLTKITIAAAIEQEDCSLGGATKLTT